ncbi:hypothetical protein [Pseudomonas syringae]|uniref:hypothetical protein n=1 Tax=Pseudomonas syringae TaxID=317 RepID=UPI000EFF5B5E|nr:hypothetical protein [Pseudomonas syringae]
MKRFQDVDAMENVSSMPSLGELLDSTTTILKDNNYSDIKYTEWEAVIYAQNEINEAAEQRNLWYVKIERGDIIPCINENNELSLACAEISRVYPTITKLIQTKAQDYIDGLKHNYEKIDASRLEESLLKSMKEFCRYIPDLNNQDASYYIDSQTLGIGATIKKSGTLSLLVHEPGCVDFSYARKARHGGLVRVTGTANFTQYTKNSEYIDIILGLVEGK